MAIDYSLGVATDLTPRQILEIMGGTGNTMPEIRTLPERPQVFHLVAPDLELLAHQMATPLAPLTHALWVEGLGVSLGVRVTLLNAEDSDGSVIAMLRAIMNLINQTQDDLALLYHSPALVRNSGKLTINPSHELWRPEYLELITVLYEVKDMPIL